MTIVEYEGTVMVVSSGLFLQVVQGLELNHVLAIAVVVICHLNLPSLTYLFLGESVEKDGGAPKAVAYDLNRSVPTPRVLYILRCVFQ